MTTDARELALLPSRTEMVRALEAQDPGYDGIFWVAVRTTGIFCRPGCRPPRPPRPENVEFFGSTAACLEAGYRPCKLCRPDQAGAGTSPDIAALIREVDQAPELRLSADDLRRRGLAPERVRRWFQEHHGMTFAAWCRARRLSRAYREIQTGSPVDDAILSSGFESHSGFREAFGQAFGKTPGRVGPGAGDPLLVTQLDSPIGTLFAAARDAGLAVLEFPDRKPQPERLESLRRAFGVPVLPGRHPHLETLARELEAYFEGRGGSFTVPMAAQGTPFQHKVWDALTRIPFGQTLSYEALAQQIGQPTAMRAVARANAQNPISILVPCHRVIGKDGTLTGYGGGLWRKRLLLELERTGRLPGTPPRSGPAS